MFLILNLVKNISIFFRSGELFNMKQILVHVHIFYHHLWKELIDCVNNITQPIDLYVTISGKQSKLVEKITSICPEAKIIICENKGFDIAPFLKVLNDVNLDDYDYIVKIHSKRDCEYAAYINGKKLIGSKWRDLLLSPIKTKENWEKSLNLFEDSKVGMVAEGVLILNKTRDCPGNLCDKCIDFCGKLGLSFVNSDFVAGTMFVAKANLFKCLQHQEKLFDFSQDNLPYICERLFGAIVSAQGLKIKALNDDMINVKLYRLLSMVGRFFFYKKVSSKKVLIKVFKIPVWSKVMKG